jgi:choline dehydrogenase-like flavoprotein
VSFHELAVHFADIQRLFSLPTGPFELDADASSPTEDNFILRSAKLPTFRMRNIATALEKKIRAENLAIWLNATVTGFRLDDRGRVAAVTARNSSGSEGKISAKIICVCAGAIESTRLLLLLDAQHGDRIFKPDRQLGCWFSDHLSAPAATIIPHDRSALNATFGMRFVRSGMRDVRIEPSPSFRRAHALPGAFAHVTAHADEKSGFATLRSICHSLQSRLLPEASQMVALTRDLDWMIRAAGWRVFKARLLAPRNASFKLSLAIEQFPNATNTITLAPAQFDRNGIPLARIDWRINSEDLNNFQRLQSGLTRYWESRLAELGALRPTANELLRDLLQRDSDLFHPCGTTRMGRDVSLGVVDRNLRTFRINNLYVVSTSTFPSSGGSNPTFMLIAFALRAADRMAVTLDRRPTPEADCKWRMSLREFGLFGGIL